MEKERYKVIKMIYGYDINGFEFKQTSGSCPEQYDVFKDGKQVGYVRLRWGCLRCDMPDCGGKTVFEHYFSDSLLGGFEDATQRDVFLGAIAVILGESLGESLK